MKYSKTKTSFYRRLFVAYLIDGRTNTVPAIMEATGMPRRTAQDTIASLPELDIEVEFIGATKNGYYKIKDWGAIDKGWVEKHLKHVKAVLEYF